MSSVDQRVAGGDVDRTDAIAVASGSTEAFERLYARHSSKVYSLARWMGFPGEAEDVTQEIFLLVWRKSSSWNETAEFATWLRRLSINVILSHRRAARSKSQVIVESGEEDLVIEKSAAVAPVPELRISMESAIENLSPAMRDVFVLHDVEGFNHHEISELLDIPAGTSASRLHRARMILREVLIDA